MVSEALAGGEPQAWELGRQACRYCIREISSFWIARFVVSEPWEVHIVSQAIPCMLRRWDRGEYPWCVRPRGNGFRSPI